MEKIVFEDMESGESVEFFVLEQTTLNEKNYLLVTDEDPDSEDANAYIFERIGESEEAYTYEGVEDEDILNALLPVFEELLEDTDIQ
ncbi:MAG: DUF1292 domain-containing protein [Lachnospiraceae bacterium]|nr:DUF1292 domain-containing protein [Lachnospiraceae bacterium]